ncbi:MAG: VOC family protein [Actinomycetota bacterium]|nr:VOC family protein [Actinomycetota bacterium]
MSDPRATSRAAGGIDLDHIAIAAEHHSDVWPRYIGDLGAAWVAGGESFGFSPAQVRFAGGMRLEVLEPFAVERNDFLRRFLDRNGPGPHHLTFKLPDLDAAIDGARAIGIEPVAIERTDPSWQEAFLHPKQAHGIVVQLAQADHGWESPPPPELPVAHAGSPATLTHVTHLVADLPAALSLFEGLLDGQPSETVTPGAVGLGGEAEAVDLAWPGPGRIRLLQPAAGTAEAAWLGNLSGRLHHIAFTVPDPAVIREAVPVGDGQLEVPPERNGGVRLLLTPA